ncbi:hypothetical protein Aab01nite_44220 [Paractinoplanes abujensis]|uniref:Outer membrane receptor protein involved in Fe transport n=1 Tax=Paractinoplanes abujensis TaxID=882441 RepID=A0A7W7CK59_9ACTN|nr:hypothetical protein [Actinoplanes abujensis]MBB4690059.1 outer membrane receptor protein involved in Fe transport [Actinoplanes abujensis]GID20832.1 hypothetical protein Aab01nite_44220 [Actinoplanes abujensis]
MVRIPKIALLAAGVLVIASACGTATNSTTTAAPASAAPVTTAQAATKSTCEALGQAYGKNMAPFAEALTKYVADRKTIATAQSSLAAFATAVQEATATSKDAQIKADGKQAADKMHAKSTDAKFFSAIKTSKDVDKTLGPTMSDWLSPVQRHCS